MGLHKKMLEGDVLYLQRGEEVIALYCHEFIRGSFGGMKVEVIIDADKSWDIQHMEGGKNHANSKRNSQEETAKKQRQESIYNHKSDTPY